MNGFHIFGGMAVVVVLLYETETEKRQHLSAIHMLSHDLEVAEDSIRPLYENELRGLKEHAPRIKTFLSIFVSRHIKEKINKYAT
ncbi:MAG: hypothetical protein U9Q89_08660 [Thermodesulfobacteriota bacterium]|nr:hypothetical protein [Thermodesulfobacteriota bacterium]